MLWPSDGVVTLAEEDRTYQVITPELPIRFPATFSPGQTEVNVDLTIYWCEAINETLCFVERGTVTMPVTVDASVFSSTLQIAYTLVPPDLD
ncbi:MAG: hypothetical protein HC915_16355 [Anaerolineae bacterium]|nr:hypothetical protein [Anaerolineae bacterium]